MGERSAFFWRGAVLARVDTDYANSVAVTGHNSSAFPGSFFGGAGVSRLVFGGGRGAADQNRNSGGDLAKMLGRTGDGILVIRSGSFTGNGTIDMLSGMAKTILNNGALDAGAVVLSSN